MRIYAMLDPTEENFKAFSKPYCTDRLTVRSFKIYSDGALGSRGAWLLEPYSDDQQNRGFLLQDTAYYHLWAKRCKENGFQLNVHAIGDAANELMLTVFALYNEKQNDLRWRIEHAQVLAEKDIDLFGNYGIIPSVQPTHATSDMNWAVDRLGDRIRFAYAYKLLMQQNGWIPLGTDFPVEFINPMFTFFAAVARQDADCMPEAGFQPENALTRKEALRGMTIWAAMANFEENKKGSIEVGKVADFIILDRDIMRCPIREARDARVLRTVLKGETVYEVESL
jgi:predicted amidohydrolase YtcJ